MESSVGTSLVQPGPRLPGQLACPFAPLVTDGGFRPTGEAYANPGLQAGEPQRAISECLPPSTYLLANTSDIPAVHRPGITVISDQLPREAFLFYRLPVLSDLAALEANHSAPTLA